MIDVCDDLVPILTRLINAKPSSALLIDSNRGQPFFRLRGGNGRFARAMRDAGLKRKGLSFYSLRHTFAADLIAAGWQIRDVAALLGNSPRTAELHYAHVMPGRAAKVVKSLHAVQPWLPLPQAGPVASAEALAPTAPPLTQQSPAVPAPVP